MSNLVKVDPKEFGLEANKASEIVKQFAPSVSECEAATKVYDEIIKKDLTLEVCQEAADLKKVLAKIRTGIDKIHKVEKAFYRAGGLFVDAWKNSSQAPVIQMETKLIEIKDYFDNIEAQKVIALQTERDAILFKIQTVHDYTPDNLGVMSDEVWGSYLAGEQLKHDARIQREEEGEKERIAKEKAEITERKRIKEENEQLKKEAEEAERLAKIEQDKRDEIEAKRLKKERDDELKRQVEAKRLQDIADAELKKEQDAKAKLEAELKEKAEEAERLEALQIAEQKEKAEQAEALETQRLADIETELNKGDADKIKDLIADLGLLKTKYSFKSAKNKKMYVDVASGLSKLIKQIKG